MEVFDVQFFYLLNSLAGQSPALDGLIVFFASYLPYILVIFALVLVLFSPSPKREKRELLFVAAAASIIARFGVTEIIRFFYHRPRPFLDLPVTQLLTSSEWSFPSGHAAFFFALATVLYCYNKKWGVGFFTAALLIGTSRVVAGIHYPSDIIGGALIGVGVAYATVSLVRRIASADRHVVSVN